MSFLGLFKSPEEKKQDLEVKKRRAKLTAKMQKEYEKEYEKQYEKQALEKVRQKAEEQVKKKLNPVPWSQRLKAVGSVVGTMDQKAASFWTGQPAKNTVATQKKVAKKTIQTHKESHKTVNDLINSLPQ